MMIFDESQVSQMLVAAKDTSLEPILYLAATTGVRQMELLGLKWLDLDWIKHTIKVESQLSRPEEGKAQFTSPKTKYGRRTIALGSRVIEVCEHTTSVSILRDCQPGKHGSSMGWSSLIPVEARSIRVIYYGTIKGCCEMQACQ
jgi:integrase